MDDGDIIWIEPRSAALAFRSRLLNSAPKPLQALVACGEDAQTLLWQLDWAQLGADERTWLEGGEYLPALAFDWLDRAATLMRLCDQQRQSAALLEVPSRCLTQLSISDLMHAMGSDIWLDDAQVALVWGFAHDALMHPQTIRWPLPCRGAVFPHGDGLSVGWWAPSADIALLGSIRH